MLEGPGQNASYSAEYMEESVTQFTDAVGEDQSVRVLRLSLNGERVAQHALISGLLALEVLVTGSLPAAMLTQVWRAPGSFLHLKCSAALRIRSAHSTGICYKRYFACRHMPYMSFFAQIALPKQLVTANTHCNTHCVRLVLLSVVWQVDVGRSNIVHSAHLCQLAHISSHSHAFC